MADDKKDNAPPPLLPPLLDRLKAAATTDPARIRQLAQDLLKPRWTTRPEGKRTADPSTAGS